MNEEHLSGAGNSWATVTYMPGWDAIDWGSAPSWAAFTVATLGGVLAAGAYRRENRRDRVNEELRLRAQASKVAAWRGTTVPPGSSRLLQVKRPAFLARNASELPVESVTLEMTAPDGQVLEVFLGTLAPDETRDVAIPGDLRNMEVSLSLAFVDAQGVAWTREKGRLAATPEASQPPWYRAFAYEPAGLLAEVFAGFAEAITDTLREAGRSLGQIFGRFTRRR